MNIQKVPRYIAVHEAAHAVIARQQGGRALAISLVSDPTLNRTPCCCTSWAADGDDWTEGRLLMAAAGPAATAIYTHSSLDDAIVGSGWHDWQLMEKLGSTDDTWFTEARRLCRSYWPIILAVADAALTCGNLCEAEIISAMKGAA